MGEKKKKWNLRGILKKKEHKEDMLDHSKESRLAIDKTEEDIYINKNTTCKSGDEVPAINYKFNNNNKPSKELKIPEIKKPGGNAKKKNKLREILNNIKTIEKTEKEKQLKAETGNQSDHLQIEEVQIQKNMITPESDEYRKLKEEPGIFAEQPQPQLKSDFSSQIDKMVYSYDKTPDYTDKESLKQDVKSVEPDIETDASQHKEVYKPVRDQVAKKTRWSDKTAEDVGVSETIISVDNIEKYSDLILPKSVTFNIEELHIDQSKNSLDLSDRNAIMADIEGIAKPTFIPKAIKEIKPEVSPQKKDVKKSRFDKFKELRFGKAATQASEKYDIKIHGPIVNLYLKPEEGVEEIEIYQVNEPYAYVRIIYDNNSHEYNYQIIEPELSDAEKELLKELEQGLFETLDVNTKDMTTDVAIKTLTNAIDVLILDYGIKLSPVSREKILYHINKEFLGNGMIDAIMHDKYIEDISCDGLNSPIFVYHSNYESLLTNLKYTSATELDSFVTKLAQKAGKYISIAEPMLDATMTDGSRIQMTLGQEVTAHGSTFTIRKFKDEPITPTDLIEWGTYSPLSVAYIWLAVENGQSCIFAGGTASGKTTSLNAISLFIPSLAKIISLEDTRELKLPHQNWIPSITRESFDTDGKGSIDMYELLKAALRQRPEYLIIGEVRGSEALTLFQAMSTGHVTYATMHADSVASMVHRLENAPLNVPRNMLSALNLVSIQIQTHIGGKRIRRNKQIIEILDIDPRTHELITNEVFRWHPTTDEIRYSGKSFILEEIMEERGWNEARMHEELKRRQEILEWMRIKKLRNYQDVSKILISYSRNPESIMELVRADLYE